MGGAAGGGQFGRLCVAAACVLGAFASSAAQLVLEPSAAVRCVASVDPTLPSPAYPAEEWRSGKPGRVKVELSFDRADEPPKVNVIESEGGASFVTAVREHVARLRVPCLSASEASARLVQNYVFQPGRQEFVPDIEDPEVKSQAAAAACLKHVRERRGPVYPAQALYDGEQGRLMVRMRFASADSPPRVELLARNDVPQLRSAVLRWAEGYRLPCYDGVTRSVSLTYAFSVEGSKPYGFKDISLVQFLGRIEGIRRQRVFFDFNAMGCPFDINLTYLQPLAPNVVEQEAPAHPARATFLAWLRQVRLNLPPAMLDAAFADTLTLAIPCTKIDLNPQEHKS